MQIRPLSETFAVSPQIAVSDVAEIARLGYTRIINNRPDGEDAGQPADAEIAAAAAAAGLAHLHLPVRGMCAEADVRATRAAIAEGGRTLAFCRSGTRSCVVWALARAGDAPTADIIAAGARQGYDLSSLAALLDQRAAEAG